MDGPKDLSFYLDLFASRQLPVPPSERRDLAEERRLIQAYLESVENKAELESLVSAHPSMAMQTRAAILLPARFEEKRLPCFFAALDQDLGPVAGCREPRVEVIILNNWRSGERPDRTADLVQEQSRRPGLGYRLLYLERAWRPDEAGQALPRSRKLLADFALTRAARRQGSSGPLYLFTEDADVERIEPGRTEGMISYLDRRPGVDALRGVLERTPEVLARNDLALFERRSWYATESQLSHACYWPSRWAGANFYWNRVVTPGWNCCFAASTYALIGGYTLDICIFEDMDIGQRISVLRGSWDVGRFIPDVSTVHRVRFRAASSPVRAMLALLQERHIYDNRDDHAAFFDPAAERQVRDLSAEQLLVELAPYAFISSVNLARFNRLCTDLFRETRRIVGEPEARRVFSRALAFVGLGSADFSVADDEVRVLDPRPFRKHAQIFAERVLCQSGRS